MADWINLPDVMADADESLHSGMMKTIQTNLGKIYLQSGYDLFAAQQLGYYTKQFYAPDLNAWQWMSTSARVPEYFDVLPLPVSYGRQGLWNPIQISMESDRNGGAGNMYARAYLLDSSREPFLDADDGVIGDQAYDEQSVSIVGGWRPLVFDPIYPRLTQALTGGQRPEATVEGLLIFVVWLRIAIWTDTAQQLDLRALRVREIPE